MPPRTSLYVVCDAIRIHENQPDQTLIGLDLDGYFDLRAVPAGLVILSLNGNLNREYHISGRNLSVDPVSQFGLNGRLDQDVTNFIFLLDKGALPPVSQFQYDADYQELRNLPLRGAENTPDPAEQWYISGHVLDAVTRQPIPHFQVTGGRMGLNFKAQANWSPVLSVEGTNGFYQTYVRKQTGRPLFKVEAEGYWPACLTNLPARNITNADFFLQPGAEVAGRMVRPDGQPAAGVTVLLLNDDYNQAKFYGAGILQAAGVNQTTNPAVEQTTDAAGRFTFKPLLGMKAVAAATTNGFVLVSTAALGTNPIITLEPYGAITGTVTRAGRPATNEQVRLEFDHAFTLGRGINWGLDTTTDAQGRFAFDHVPAVPCRLTDNKITTHGENYSGGVSQAVELKPGQTLEMNLVPVMQAGITSTPPPKRVPSVDVKGLVLRPDGRPAADAEVALDAEDQFLSVGEGVFAENGLREKGLIVNTGTDGSFTLPLCEQVRSVIAVSPEGYAQVSLAALKQSPRITLGKWGRIEGTLRVGRHPGTNEFVSLASSSMDWPPLYNISCQTDNRGHFEMTFVPPGGQILSRQVRIGPSASSLSLVAHLDVPPGATLVTNVGGTGRLVLGKIKAGGDTLPAFTNFFADIATTARVKYLEIESGMKTGEEVKAFRRSDATKAVLKEAKEFAVVFQPDGSFRAEDMAPGRYMLEMRSIFRPGAGKVARFLSVRELVVPPARDENDAAAVDWGEVEMTQQKLAN